LTRLCGWRAAGRDEPEGGEQGDEQSGAEQRCIPHNSIPHHHVTRTLALRYAAATANDAPSGVVVPLISTAKRQDMVNAEYRNRVNDW
jgi:hypothetical protein